MGIITRIKHWLPSRRKEQLSRINGLPETQRKAELGNVYYTECLDQAVRFVQEQIARGDDSPFRGAQRERFFHEVMAVNFWALEKVFAGKCGALMSRVYDIYQRSFHGLRTGDGSVPEWIAGRFSAYNAAWNDVTGHQDVFGRRVAEHIFPQGQAFSVPETSYWIIEYAHEVLEDFREIRELCRSMKIALT
jgi:hypothetical protein